MTWMFLFCYSGPPLPAVAWGLEPYWRFMSVVAHQHRPQRLHASRCTHQLPASTVFARTVGSPRMIPELGGVGIVAVPSSRGRANQRRLLLSKQKRGWSIFTQLRQKSGRNVQQGTKRFRGENPLPPSSERREEEYAT